MPTAKKKTTKAEDEAAVKEKIAAIVRKAVS